MLEAHEDIEVILRQTRVLLAPSLWQECCPLVVMEALVRGIPCVSSDACGLPEANRYAPLVAPAALCYDFTRGALRRGLTNAALEQELGASSPPRVSDGERAAAAREAAAAAVRRGGAATAATRRRPTPTISGNAVETGGARGRS